MRTMENKIGKIQESLTKKLQAAFAPVLLKVLNESSQHRRNPNGETHFRVVIVSGAFEGLGRVVRHQSVQSLLQDERHQGLHALTLTCLTESELQANPSLAEISSPLCVTHSAPAPKSSKSNE